MATKTETSKGLVDKTKFALIHCPSGRWDKVRYVIMTAQKKQELLPYYNSLPQIERWFNYSIIRINR
jgi:hypothetical protein